MPDKTLVLFDPRMVDHDPGPHHPESPDRLRVLETWLANHAPSRIDLDLRAPRPAARGALEVIHDPRYLDKLDALRNQRAALDADTTVSPGSVDAAYLGAGAAIDAVEALALGTHKRAFALVRPPGHHAEYDRAMGFCLLNNIAIAAQYARQELGFKRILIVDWDVHHGNGTEHAFYERRDVLVFNTHRYPFYPGTGALEDTGRGEGSGYTVNVPLPPGMGDGDYGEVFHSILLPIADEFEPDLVLVSAGFDAHEADPLGGMNLTSAGFAYLCDLCRQIADRHCAGRIALLLEGGYDLTALTDSVASCLGALAGHPSLSPHAPSDATLLALERIRHHLRAYWALP